MAVNLDSGLYRHLSFRHPKRGFNWFEIITWPWGLTFNGDHGCWSFSRIEDMFEFFSRPSFSDTWEIDGTQPYLYALYAIIWAIQQYEQYKGGK
jgi:hypothetical protein